MPGSSGNSTASFVFDVTNDDNTVTMNYKEPLDETSANVGNTIPRIYELMKELSQSYNVVPVISNFNLSQLKLVSQSNPDTWFVFNIQ